MAGGDMQHRRLVRIDALPAVEMIKQTCRRRRGRQQHGVDVIVLEQSEKQIDVLELERAVILHYELFAVQLRPPVDEYGESPRDQIPREWKVIENMPGVLLFQHVHGRGR